MALANYTDLKASIASWLHRTDLTAVIPDFITLAEAKLRTVLTARLQETSGTIATVAGVSTATLPDALLSVASLSIPGQYDTLDYLTPEQFFAKYGAADTGVPREYTMVGGTIHFGPKPDAVYSVSAVYRASVPALSDAAPTNALLTKWPNAYLFAALVESITYTKDEASRGTWEEQLRIAVTGINLLDWHAAGPMVMRSDARTV